MSVFRFVPLLGLALALRTSPSAAADFTVTNFNDSDPPAAGSLRAAVQAANATPGLDRIFIPRDGTVAVTAGELTITDALEIQGLGAGVTFLNAGNASRVFSIIGDINHPDAVSVVLRGLTLTGGNSGDTGGGAVAVLDFAKARIEDSLLLGNQTNASGGAIYVYQSQLSLVSTVVRENTAADVGGGIASEESLLDITRCVVRNNTSNFGGGVGASGVLSGLDLKDSRIESNAARNMGGGLALSIPHATVGGSTISGNTAEYAGGGAYLLGTSDAEPLVIQNSTLSGNVVSHEAGHGSGVELAIGALQVRNSTVAFNRVANANAGGDGIGGGVSVGEGGHTIELVSTLVAGNTRGAANVPSELARGIGIDGPPSTISARRSLIQYTPEAGVLNGTNVDNLIGVDPLLQPLADNGGPTRTHALGPGSPACDRGENSAGLAFDQRGAPFARGYGQPDIGAYEHRGDTIFYGDFELHVTTLGCMR
jgi:hypothetical protein